MNIETLRRMVEGTVITPDEPGYGAARLALIWNGRKPSRHPKVIVRAASVGDVQYAVRYAKAAGMRLSVRGSGHQFSGIAVQDGVVVDLGDINHIHVDPIFRTADVGPGAKNGDAARIFGEYGFGFPLGHCATVALSGYLLGGGFGWNSGAWGVACFNVESVEVVLADGQVHRASETENPDIFWAARGSGPEFFGVVTSYRLKLQPLPRAITTSVFTYPIADAARVERWMNHVMKLVPATVEFTMVQSSAPPPLAHAVDKVATGIATVFADTDEEAHATLSRIASLAPSGAIDIQQNLPTPFETLYAIIGQFFPEGHRYAVDTHWGAPQALDFLSQLASETAKAPSPRSFSLGVVLPPQVMEMPMPDTAFSMAGRAFTAAYAIWQDKADDDANIGWLRALGRRLAPSSIGAYVGEADLDEPRKLEMSYSPAAWTRIKALQEKYDPQSIFRSEQSLAGTLKPAA